MTAFDEQAHLARIVAEKVQWRGRAESAEREREEWKAVAERATANAERLLWALESIPRDKLPIRDRVALIAVLEAPRAAPPSPEQEGQDD